jgi:hypothetical protein
VCVCVARSLSPERALSLSFSLALSLSLSLPLSLPLSLSLPRQKWNHQNQVPHLHCEGRNPTITQYLGLGFRVQVTPAKVERAIKFKSHMIIWEVEVKRITRIWVNILGNRLDTQRRQDRADLSLLTYHLYVYFCITLMYYLSYSY